MKKEGLTAKLRESLAAEQQAIWAHWMNYLFAVTIDNGDGTCPLPAEKVVRWKRPLPATYDDLSETEKQSDRDQVDKLLRIIESYVDVQDYE